MHKLKKEIYKNGYNITQFAKKAGIDRVTLQHLFSGKNKSLRGDTIYLISQAFNKPYDEIEELCNGKN